MTDLRIYYTDDDPEDQELFQEVIDEEFDGWEVSLQKNGYELIQQLGNDTTLPNVIFLDLNIPKKNGAQVLRELKGSEQLKSIPVVILTTSSDPKMIDIVRDLGASFFITKPESYNDLKKAIGFVLSIEWHNFKPSQDNFVFKN